MLPRRTGPSTKAGASAGWAMPPVLASTATRSSPPAKAAWSRPTIVRLARLAWNLRDHAFSTERHFWHKFVGFNYRMTNLQAAIGLAQMEQLDEFVAARRRNAAEYTRLLDGIPGIMTPPQAPWAKNVYWMYGILVDAQTYGMNRDDLRKVLADHGIETRTFFIPMHCQPVYWKQFKGQRYPVAERLCRDGFYLPSASSLSLAEIDYITEVIRAAGAGLRT